MCLPATHTRWCQTGRHAKQRPTATPYAMPRRLLVGTAGMASQAPDAPWASARWQSSGDICRQQAADTAQSRRDGEDEDGSTAHPSALGPCPRSGKQFPRCHRSIRSLGGPVPGMTNQHRPPYPRIPADTPLPSTVVALSESDSKRSALCLLGRFFSSGRKLRNPKHK